MSEKRTDSQPHNAAEQMYTGVWKMLNRYLHVPTDPLELRGCEYTSFKPDEAFTKYLQTQVWIIFSFIFIGTMIALVAITVANPLLGIFIALFVLPIEVLIGFIFLVATKFQFDSTWYALTDRAARMRRGIWIVHETTVTFENVQNVRVEQGPLERWFDLSRVIIETAGAGSSGGKNPQLTASRAVIEGVRNAEELRDRILRRVREATGAGLGDEEESDAPRSSRARFSRDHLDALRAIRDELRQMRSA